MPGAFDERQVTPTAFVHVRRGQAGGMLRYHCSPVQVHAPSGIVIAAATSSNFSTFSISGSHHDQAILDNPSARISKDAAGAGVRRVLAASSNAAIKLNPLARE
jgi:hypothetical protein